MTHSLKQRLIWILLGLILSAWIASALLTMGYARAVMQDQVDQQLEQYADLVTYISQIFSRQVDEGLPLSEPWLDSGIGKPGREPIIIDTPTDAAFKPALNIWLGDQLIAVLAESPRFERPREAGFSYLDTQTDHKIWRSLSRYDSQTGLWMRVGIEMDGARRAMMETLGRVLLPLLIILPLTVLLLYVGVVRGLRPLRDLASQISARNPNLLNPVESDQVPVEMQEVMAALNDLLARLALALEGEQRFTANAAHELVTPLAAIKTEVQLCQRQMEHDSGRAMLARIAQRVDRAIHSVEQLLTLARVDPDAPLVTAPVNLRALLEDALAESAHLASDRGLQIEIAEGAALTISANAEAMSILLRNLLVNAFRYAREGSVVKVSLGQNRSVDLEICNDCDPLTRDEFDQICKRFYRVPGSNGLGAGLGLSIVSRIAEQHGADFNVGPRADGTGFCARLSFPS